MAKVQNRFKESDLQMKELSRALYNAKMQDTYLSNEAIAKIFVDTLHMEDSANIMKEIEAEIIKRGGGSLIY